MIRRRTTPRRRGDDYVEDKAYVAWLHRQSCVAAGLLYPVGHPDAGRPAHACPRGWGGVMEADHVGVRGGGQRSGDPQAVSLCLTAHAERHGGGMGSFWWVVFADKYQRQAWLIGRADDLYRRYLAEVEAGAAGGGVPW